MRRRNFYICFSFLFPLVLKLTTSIRYFSRERSSLAFVFSELSNEVKYLLSDSHEKAIGAATLEYFPLRVRKCSHISFLFFS